MLRLSVATMSLCFGFLGCAAQAPLAVSPAAAVHHTEIAAGVAAPEHLASTDGRWADFRQDRALYELALGDVLISCSKDDECRDAGRSTLLAYGLVALHRLTGNRRYLRAAHVIVDAAPVHEGVMAPHDAAWLLALDVEWEQSLYDAKFRTAAKQAATDLEAWLEGLDDYEWTVGLMFGGDDNVSWPLLTLWRWARHTHDDALAARVKEMAQHRLLDDQLDEWCPLLIDRAPDPREMFPPCLQRTVSIAEILPEHARVWLPDFLAGDHAIYPIDPPALGRHGALNFSRSWSLWTLYQLTEDVRHRNAYIEHLRVQMRGLQQARRRGDAVDLRLAVFGVHALAMSEAG